MALRSTVYKADLTISDMDRGYYATHALRIARHPSETEGRLMVRTLAFAMRASESLLFAGGLSTSDEPDLWQKDLTGSIELWIDVGLPDDKLLRKACGRADQVLLLAYGGSKADLWWAQAARPLERCDNLTVMAIAPAQLAALEKLADRAMTLNCTIQDNQVWIDSERGSATVEPVIWQAATR
jgi:uncharacterized protein YaeQ